MIATSYKMANLELGDHLLCFYESEEEHRSLFTPFIRHGINRNEKIIYAYDAHTPETIKGYMQDAGIDIEPHIASKQLIFIPAEQFYLHNGMFLPDEIINECKHIAQQTLSEGYTGLRVTGEATWALKVGINLQRIIEYEAQINDFFPGSKCIAVCQYDKRRFDSRLMLDLLRVHPIAILT